MTLLKRMKGFFFVTSPATLKNTSYNDLPVPLRWDKITNGRKLYVEIGSGHGEVLVANDPKESVAVGYEIKSRFFRLGQRKIAKRTDSYIFKGSGYESLGLHYANESIDKLFILFPDPWHKKKHNKRRPLTAAFFQSVVTKLSKHGEILIATDWPDYVSFITEEVAQIGAAYDVTITSYSPEKFALPVTHYYQKWVRKGRSFTAFILKKKD